MHGAVLGIEMSPLLVLGFYLTVSYIPRQDYFFLIPGNILNGHLGLKNESSDICVILLKVSKTLHVEKFSIISMSNEQET